MPDIVVMFFLLGVVAGLVRSDLTIPKAAYDVLSLLLMLTIGLKGGIALHGNVTGGMALQMLAIMVLGFVLPVLLYPVLRKLVKLSVADSASFVAHYGSVSAGTFAVALAFAQNRGLPVGGEATIYLVLLELPALLVGIILFRRFAGDTAKQSGAWPVIRHALTSRSVILLVGGVIIGWLYGPQQGAMVTDLLMAGFKAILALFLLEMGLTAAEALTNIRRSHWRVVVFALVAPPILSLAGLATGVLLGLPVGSTVILASLTASASYIAAPVAVRGSIPQADLGLAMLASLGITFPFNVIVGIPLYTWMLGY
ncbi:MAG: sodium-dependent bicarbonate transport family permease [Marinobacter sp.]|nr:sodium-dependent bicarbonate transport family permease [Marinobacter sp.]